MGKPEVQTSGDQSLVMRLNSDTLRVKKIIFLILFLGLTSCKNSKGDKDTGDAALPEEQLNFISKTICTDGKSLKLIDSADQSIGTLRTAVAFVSGSTPCAMTDGINDAWYDLSGGHWFFELSFDNSLGCISNNSVWMFLSGQTADGNIEYFYTDFEKTRQLRIKANYDVPASYALNHAGLRVLSCQ